MTLNTEDLDPERLLDEPSYFVEHYIGVEPFDYQQQFMDHPSQRKAFVSGRRVGKSRTASWLALWKAVTYQNAEILITAPSRRQSKEIFLQIKKEVRSSPADEEAFGIGRDTQTEINFTSGSRIKVVPVGRDGSNIRTFGADLLIVDEAAFVDDNIFQEVLSPMLAVGNDNTWVLTSTPFGKKGFLYDRWDEATDDDMSSNDPDTNWFPMHVPTEANPLIDDSFIEEQRKQLTDMQFRQEILGKFVESADAFFTREEWMNCAHKPKDATNGSWRITRDAGEPAYLGVDLGGSGEDESVYVSVDANGNVFDIDHENSSLTDSMKTVGRLDRRHDYNKIVIDSTGLGEGPVEQLQESIGRKVEGFKFTNEKKQSLYNTLKTTLQNEEISFGFQPGKDEEENRLVRQGIALEYSHTQSGKLRIEHPPDEHDDYTDALALAVWAKSQKNFARGDVESMKPFTLGSLQQQR